jgi:hypothetical protein
MRVTIDRNLCGAWSPACEECFSVFVRRDFAMDRACITGAWDDGSEDVSVVVHSGQHTGTLKITLENREAIIREGWRAYIDLPDEAFEIQPPHGEYMRTAARQS